MVSVTMILIVLALALTIYEVIYTRTLLSVAVLLICIALLVGFVK